MQEAIYSVTFVTGKPPMITVRADNAVDWKNNLTHAAESGALTEIRKINDSLNGVRPDLAKGIDYERLDKAQQQRQEAAAQPAQELPAGFANPPCQVCAAATRFDKAGTSQQSGRPYKRYLCTADSTHKATFTD